MPRWYAGGDTARRSYYDRDPVNMLADYSAVQVPHAMTVRWSYTPPVGFAAFIEATNIFVSRITAGSAAAVLAGRLEFLPYYGGTYLVATATLVTNTVGESARTPLSSLGYMAYGDTLRFQTVDPSTGGSILYQGSFKGTEFLY